MNMQPLEEFSSTSKIPLSVASANSEMPFGIDEMFFSKTDKRGVIDAFNSVFLRVSGFGAEELHGAPHKILRHHDMPQAVFWLLWNGLQNGHPVGAYVKNKTKNGKFYWVFALAAPVENGYFSVRIKPSSDLYLQVVELYKEIRTAELSENLTAEESARRLLLRLAEMGFPNYSWFQSTAFCTEFEARQNAMKLPTMPDVVNTQKVSQLTSDLQHELNALAVEFDSAEILTANMKIFAAKLDQGRATINEIAKNYDLMLRDIQYHLKTLLTPPRASGIWASPEEKKANFMLCGYHLLDEVVQGYIRENAQHGAEELHQIDMLRSGYKAQSDSAVDDCVKSALTVRRRIDFLLRMVLGLSTIRIACRVEAGSLSKSAQGLDTIIGRLDSFHDTIEARMVKIQDLVTNILQCIGKSEH
ncbi:Aerotaxis receptor [Thalassovita gelatinovora]|uniref:Aerotaxis receptor n=1 Tax=Thalassovita gelatinovora TaxID=53501 RepID=A0A0P1FEU6_THAGE|nr:PAS domain-containing protein [Thalassovita gelatinovora]QIZ79707.1 PAS domain-containing protein [Thalassovita gelatinovora]CUH66689.1 Aerotaxis receptor [Thalassovita gelatinovora]SEQ40937.1 aerotaxis receptor [Thalassovita gelatinovora]